MSAWRRSPEQALQIAVASYMGWAVRSPPVAWTAFPAGGGGLDRGRILKGMGLKAGWPDVQMIYDSRYYGIELKTTRGVLSQAQRAAHRTIEAAGGHVEVCRSLDAVRAVLAAWEIPTRETKPSTRALREAVALAVSHRC